MPQARATPFPVTADVLKEWARRWDDEEGTGSRLWADIEGLAGEFWALCKGDLSSTEDGLNAWNHLLLAVANFKRSSGRLEGISEIKRRRQGPPGTGVRLNNEVSVPRNGGAENYRTAFKHLPGMGVATGATLLAALWPDRHLIIDRRALAVALVVDSEGWGRLTRRSAFDQNRYVVPTWEDYEWFLKRARASISKRDGIAELSTIERAFYALDVSWGRNKASQGDWGAYRRWIRMKLSLESAHG